MKRNIRMWLIIIAAAAAAAFAARYLAPGFTGRPAAAVKPPDTAQARGQPQPKKTIVFSFGGNDPGGSMKATIEAFEKANPAVGVKVQQLPNSTDYQRDFYKRALYSGDSSIDVFFSDIIWTAELASSNWVVPLEGYFSRPELDKYLQNALEGCKYKGRLYAIPGRTDIPFLFYRSDIIRTPPGTFREMMELSKKYKDASGIKYGYVFQGQAYEGLVCTALEYVWNNGGSVMKDGRVTINSPEAVEGLQALVDMLNSGVAAPDVFNFQEEDARIAFQDGNALFMRNWPYVYNQLASDNSKVKGKFDIAPLPVGPKGTVSKGTLGGWNYMINNNTRNLKEALDFVKYMGSYETEVLDSSTGGSLPAIKAAYDDPRVQKANPWIKGLTDSFRNADLRPATAAYSSVSKVMQSNFSNAIQGRISAANAIENIEKSLAGVIYEK